MRWGRCPALPNSTQNALHPPFSIFSRTLVRPHWSLVLQRRVWLGSKLRFLQFLVLFFWSPTFWTHLTRHWERKNQQTCLVAMGQDVDTGWSLHRPKKVICFDMDAIFANDTFGRHGPTWSYTFYRGTVVNAWNIERCRAPFDTFQKARLQLKNLPFHSQSNSMQSFDQFGLSEPLDCCF